MAQLIGYQDGIEWFVGFVRKIPGVKYRTADKRPPALEQWHGLEKLERTLRILKTDHDNAIVVQPAPDPPPPPPPPPPAGPIAPRTYNGIPSGEPSARFCTTGLPRNDRGRLHDIYAEYDDDGRDLGGRTNLQVPGLKPANSMDGRGPCDPYEWQGQVFPPWPAASYER